MDQHHAQQLWRRLGKSANGPGVAGLSDNIAGVMGASGTPYGVYGTSASDVGRNCAPGQVFMATAADANLTLAELGYDALLNFKLGTGPYLYHWFLSGPDGLTLIWTGQYLNWEIPNSVLVFGKESPAPQTIVLPVTDAASSHSSQNTSTYAISFTAVPPI